MRGWEEQGRPKKEQEKKGPQMGKSTLTEKEKKKASTST
jgi:hypothetical protein